MNGNVLISGARVAGLALAYWLDRAGFGVTLVERASEFRRGGQAVDIRGVALDVVQATGLLDDARALRTRLKGMSMLDDDGNEIERTEERTRELVRHWQKPAQAFATYEARMRPYVNLNQALVDLTRQGPVPDELLTHAKNGIDLRDLLKEVD